MPTLKKEVKRRCGHTRIIIKYRKESKWNSKNSHLGLKKRNLKNKDMEEVNNNMKILNPYTFTAMIIICFVTGGIVADVGEVREEYIMEWDVPIMGAIIFLSFFGMGFMSGRESKED